MSIALDEPAEPMPSGTPSVSLHRRIRQRCAHSSVLLDAGSYGKRRKVSITIRQHRHATSGAGERESRSERSSRDYQEIPEAAMLRTARSGGVSGMLHRTTVRRADHIGGIVSVGLGDRTASDLVPRERAEAIAQRPLTYNLSFNLKEESNA